AALDLDFAIFELSSKARRRIVSLLFEIMDRRMCCGEIVQVDLGLATEDKHEDRRNRLSYLRSEHLLGAGNQSQNVLMGMRSQRGRTEPEQKRHGIRMRR